MYTTYHRQIRVIVAVNPSRSRLLPSVHHLLLRLLDLYLRRPASRKTKLLTLVTPSYLAAPLPSCPQPIYQPSTIAKVLSLSRFDKAQKLIFIRGWKSRGQIGFGHTALGPSARTPLNYVVRGKRRSGQGRIFGGWEGAPRAWLLIEQTSTRRLCRQERYSPFFLGCAGWVLKISFIRGIVVRISYFFFFIRFLLTVVSKLLEASLHQHIFPLYLFLSYLNFKKIVDLISTERDASRCWRSKYATVHGVSPRSHPRLRFLRSRVAFIYRSDVELATSPPNLKRSRWFRSENSDVIARGNEYGVDNREPWLLICSGCFARLRRTRALDKYNKTHLCVRFVFFLPSFVEERKCIVFWSMIRNERVRRWSNILDKINKL